MASWPTGIETIKNLLAANSLQKVAPSYDDISPIIADDVAADVPVVRALHDMARQLADVLPVFVD